MSPLYNAIEYVAWGPSPFLQGKGDGMKEEWIAYIVKQTLQGLKYFHDQGQVNFLFSRLLCPVRSSGPG